MKLKITRSHIIFLTIYDLQIEKRVAAIYNKLVLLLNLELQKPTVISPRMQAIS